MTTRPGKDLAMRLVLATLALVGLASAVQPETPPDLPELTLKGGEAQMVPGTGITLLLTKVDDSRCPGDVDCVWEGMIRAEITVMAPTPDLAAITLCNACDDASGLATVAGMTFGLVRLSPPMVDLAKLGRPPRVTDYELTVTYGPADK
jgi:hypothetical protein